MAKFDYAKLSPKERKRLIEPLIEALHILKTKEQIHKFLTGLLTSSELVMLGRRLQAAEHLVQGESYETVREKTGIGLSTIQSVDSWLKHTVRDYQDIRAKERRDEEWRKQHERNLKPRLRHRDPRWLLIDLLTQAIAVTAISLRASTKKSTPP